MAGQERTCGSRCAGQAWGSTRSSLGPQRDGTGARAPAESATPAHTLTASERQTPQVSPRREGATHTLGSRPSRGQHGRRAGRRGAPSPGRSWAGPPSAEPARRRRTPGTRMEVLRLELGGGGLDARARRTRRQLWSSGVLRGGKLSNGGREKN